MSTTTRIELTDTILTSITKLAEGNPGALTACVDIMKLAAQIDPDNAFGSLGVLLDLDQHGIYGSRIWELYDRVCDRDMVKLVTLFRAYQLGQLAGIEASAINRAIDEGAVLDHDAALAAVRERLPNFARPTPPADEDAAHGTRHMGRSWWGL